MRSFEERKLEVINLCEQKAKAAAELKKKILYVGAPVLVCICLLIAILVPVLSNRDKFEPFENKVTESASKESSSKKDSSKKESSKNSSSKKNTSSKKDSSSKNSSSKNDKKNESSSKKDTSSTSSEEVTEDLAVIEKSEVVIYFIDGKSVNYGTSTIPLTPKDVFNEWRLQNGIGQEVELISYKIDSNSSTTVSGEGSSQVATHVIGDYFVLNLTVSKTLENYYSEFDKDVLLETLKLTMTEFGGTTFNEYNLILE